MLLPQNHWAKVGGFAPTFSNWSLSVCPHGLRLHSRSSKKGVSATVTCRQLEIGEDSVPLFYDRCFEVMAMDAVHLQSQIQWGTGTTATVEVELDCTVINSLTPCCCPSPHFSVGLSFRFARRQCVFLASAPGAAAKNPHMPSCMSRKPRYLSRADKKLVGEGV